MATPLSPPPKYSSNGASPADDSKGFASQDVGGGPAANSEYGHNSIVFAKAAFTFEDVLNRVRAKKSSAVPTVRAVEVESKPAPKAPLTTEELVEQAHQARHKQRIRIARGVQHLLTSGLSIAIAVLQGRMYTTYQSTKDKAGAWPVNPDLLPTLLLLATSIVALFIDICALIAYIWPKTDIGHRAYTIALSAHAYITTLKTTGYGFSAIVCKSSFNQGNSSGDNKDLWSWTCSDKAMAQQKVNDCTANCIGSRVAWVLALLNITIELIGFGIDQAVTRDAKRWKTKKTNEMESVADESTEMGPASIGDAGKSVTEKPKGPESKSFPLPAALGGRDGKGRYAQLTDVELDELDNIATEEDDELKTHLPNLDAKKDGGDAAS